MKQNPISKLPTVELIVRNCCTLCEAMIHKLQNIQQNGFHFNLVVTNIELDELQVTARQLFFTPATWVDGELWFTGDVDESVFISKFSGLVRGCNSNPKKEENNGQFECNR